MPEYLRVKDKSTGHEFSVIASAVDEESMQVVLEKDAADHTGEPLPPEYATKSLSSNTPSGQQADLKKEKLNG